MNGNGIAPYGVSVGVCIGTLFGIALEKSKVYLPIVIRNQMLMKDFIMMKVFLSATAIGCVITALLELNGSYRRTSKATSLGIGITHGYGANIIGTYEN